MRGRRRRPAARWCIGIGPAAPAGRSWPPTWPGGSAAGCAANTSTCPGGSARSRSAQQTQPLPGLLAPSTLLEAEDPYGQPFVLVELPQAHHYTLPIKVEPDGSALVDQDTVDTWVGHYDRWLAGLGYEPGLVAATVTIETAPDPGHVLATEVTRLLGTDAPGAEPAGAARHRRHATRPAPRPSPPTSRSPTTRPEPAAGRNANCCRCARPTNPPGACAAAARSPPWSAGGSPASSARWRMTGVGAPRPMTAAELAEQVRIAYDPAIAATVDGCRAGGEPTGIGWATAGPAGGFEHWGDYRHDSGHSITWQMVEAPKGVVESRALEDLLAPTDAVARKRVTLLYRPHDPADAASIVDADVRTAIGRATQRRGEARATETSRLDAARQAAREEASGAGLVRFALLVTATVTDPDRLRRRPPTPSTNSAAPPGSGCAAATAPKPPPSNNAWGWASSPPPTSPSPPCSGTNYDPTRRDPTRVTRPAATTPDASRACRCRARPARLSRAAAGVARHHPPGRRAVAVGGRRHRPHRRGAAGPSPRRRRRRPHRLRGPDLLVHRGPADEQPELVRPGHPRPGQVVA